MKIARIDSNQPQIVKELRKIGASVSVLSAIGKGVPDILVGFRGNNYLFEIKDGSKSPSARKLTDSESKWHDSWKGQVAIATDIESIIKVITSVTD